MLLAPTVALTLLMTNGCRESEPRRWRDPVYSPVDGTWREVARIPCDGGEEFVPPDAIGELILDGDFIRVTRHAFETNVDYYGSYKFDEGAKTISLYDLDGPDVPDDVDKSGRYELMTDRWEDPLMSETIETEMLVLRDMWLGSSPGGDTRGPACGHRFVPRNIPPSGRH